MLLKRPENFGHRGIQPTAVSVDYGLSNHPDLDMTILGQAYEQGPGSVGTDSEALGEQSSRYADLLAPGQCVSELCNLGFQLGHAQIKVRPLGSQASRYVRWLQDHASPR
jgi:hypothetical protein